MLDSTTTTIQQAYEEIRSYFTRPGAKLARTKWHDQEPADGGFTCDYRTPDGHGCAIGCRLSDAWIAAQGGAEVVNNTGNIIGLASTFPDVTRIVGVKDSPMWQFHAGAQELHDTELTTDVAHFVEQLDDMARRGFNLTVPS